jgi:hypothetical protein
VIDDWDRTRCFICRDDAEPPTARVAYEGPTGQRKYPAHAECRAWAMRARRDMVKLTGKPPGAAGKRAKAATTEACDWDVEEGYDGRFALLLGMAT